MALPKKRNFDEILLAGAAYLYLTATNNKEFTGKSSLTSFCAESSEKKTRLTNWRWWVGSGSCVVRRASCVIAHASSRRLLLVEFKETVFLYTTLHIDEKVSPIKFSKANLSAKYFLPGPLLFSRMLLVRSLFPSRPRRICM